MTAFIASRAALIAEALGIDADDRISIEVPRGDWSNDKCEETGAPGVFEVEWVTRDGDRTDRTLAGDIAAEYINALLMSEDVDSYETIYVKVDGRHLRSTHPHLAEIIDWVDMPTRIAA
jgi:hypothetical protein